MTNKEYQEFIKTYTPKKPILKNALMTFFIGGLICSLGQIIFEYCQLSKSMLIYVCFLKSSNKVQISIIGKPKPREKHLLSTPFKSEK